MIELNAHGANIKIEAHSRDLEDLRVFQKQLALMTENLGKASSARLSSAEPDLDIQLKMNRIGQIHGVFAVESERRNGVPTVLRLV